MNKQNKKNIEYFNGFYMFGNTNNIQYDDWLYMFDEIIKDVRRPIIDLGCGLGDDSKYLLDKGKKVIACDGSLSAIFNVKDNIKGLTDAICFDMLETFPFDNNTCELVIADLCLHYFTKEDTIKILSEIKRILVSKGNMLLRVNSINDKDNSKLSGEEIQKGLYSTVDGRYKRFFDYGDIFDIFNMFDIKYIREDVTNKYSYSKKVYTCRVMNRK